MLSIVICDDIAAHADYAEQLVTGAVPEEIKYEITKYLKADKLLEDIQLERLLPNIAVLDIDMPEIDGMELAGRIHACIPSCKIIFLSSFPKYASAVYRNEHIWFVLKNSADVYIPEAIFKAMTELEETSSSGILQLHTRGNTRYVTAEDVLYLERNRHSTIVVSKGSKYIVSTHPDLLTENCAKLFIRCHQSFWISIKAIKELDKNSFVLIDETRIPISRSFYKSARARFFELKFERI